MCSPRPTSASATRTTSAAGVTFTVSNQVNGSVKVNGDRGDELHRPAAGRRPGEFAHDGSETTAASFNVSASRTATRTARRRWRSTFNFTVTPVNDAPVLTGDLTATVAEGGSYTITASRPRLQRTRTTVRPA